MSASRVVTTPARLGLGVAKGVLSAVGGIAGGVVGAVSGSDRRPSAASGAGRVNGASGSSGEGGGGEGAGSGAAGGGSVDLARGGSVVGPDGVRRHPTATGLGCGLSAAVTQWVTRRDGDGGGGTHIAFCVDVTDVAGAVLAAAAEKRAGRRSRRRRRSTKGGGGGEGGEGDGGDGAKAAEAAVAAGEAAAGGATAWSVYRRYSEFRFLHKALKFLCSLHGTAARLPALPPKLAFNSPGNLDARCAKLDRYCAALLACDARALRSPLVLSFFARKAGAFLAVPLHANPREYAYDLVPVRVELFDEIDEAVAFAYGCDGEQQFDRGLHGERLERKKRYTERLTFVALRDVRGLRRTTVTFKPRKGRVGGEVVEPVGGGTFARGGTYTVAFETGAATRAHGGRGMRTLRYLYHCDGEDGSDRARTHLREPFGAIGVSMNLA